MCGITGWLDWERDLRGQRPVVERMIRTLQRRGPDAEAVWLSEHVALAHRRLIVIDPEGGAQPMTYQRGDQSYTITYNGEIYNFRELRRELERCGHTFATSSDTEVLLHAYVQWGEQCLQRLNGIFAFAVWDEARQRLFLARDHMGVKPLFYTQRGSGVLFASELKSLLTHPLVQPEVDAEGLAEIFTWTKTPGFGVYRGVAELRAGHYAVVDRDGLRTAPYWSLRSQPHTDDLPTTVERLRELLQDSVRRQMIADVPLVSLLSGGVDSSGLAALAAEERRRNGQQLHTYSIDFVDSARDFVADMLRPDRDAPWAQRAAEFVGSVHHTVMVDTRDMLDNLLVPMRSLDRPGAGSMDVALYLLCKSIKQEATVALSGESADEVFGGYFWFVNPQAALNINSFPWVPAVGFAQLMSPELKNRINPDAYVARRYQEALAEIPQPVESNGSEGQYDTKMRELLYLSQTRFLSIFMDRKDRMSMAAGFEVRVPYSDYRIVEYLWNVPWQMKAVNQIEKGILREAYTGLLPEEVRMRRKSAFPASRNPAYYRALQGITQDILNNPNAPILPLIDVKQVRALAENEAPPERMTFNVYYLDSIVQLNAWLTEYEVRLCL
jgi:asparagine synthase (glutamine-hydrolysing)